MSPNPQETADTFTEEILNGKLHFLCSNNEKTRSRHAEDVFKLSSLRQMFAGISQAQNFKS